MKFFHKFSRNELPKSVCSKFNPVHEVHTRNTCNNLLIYIPRMSTSRNSNHSLRGDGASLWNKFPTIIFFQTMIWRPSLNWNHFLWNNSYELTKMNCKLLTHTQAISSQFSLLRSFMKYSPATQSSNLMIEIDKVICMDIGVCIFYMCLYVYMLI